MEEGSPRQPAAHGRCSIKSREFQFSAAGVLLLALLGVGVGVGVATAGRHATGALPYVPPPPPRQLLSYPLTGTKATVWSGPTGLSAPRDSSIPGDMYPNVWWLNDSVWAIWRQRRDSDMGLLRYNLGSGPNVSAIVYFPAFLADTTQWGSQPLERLDEVVSFMAARGIRPIVLIGRPDIGPGGNWSADIDPVHDAGARQWLMGTAIRNILTSPAVAETVRFVSVYWMGASHHCVQGALCSPAEILSFNRALDQAVRNASDQFEFVLHLDGMFQDACWPTPCASWNYGGYTPESINGSWSLMLESWVQGSLKPAVAELMSRGVTSPERLLLLQDIRNCDLPGVPACVLGSVQADVATWFQWLGQLKLCAGGPTFGVWNFVDSPPLNEFGDVALDARNLTAKGQLNRMAAGKRSCE
jgi:hypothetical protein